MSGSYPQDLTMSGSYPQATFGSVPSMSMSGQQFTQPMSGQLPVNAGPPPTVPSAGFGSPVGTLFSPDVPQEVFGGYSTRDMQGAVATPVQTNTFGYSPVGSLVAPVQTNTYSYSPEGSLVAPIFGQSQVGSLVIPQTAGYSPVGSLDVLPPEAVPTFYPSMAPVVQTAPVIQPAPSGPLYPSMGSPPVQYISEVQSAPVEISNPIYLSMGAPLQSAPVLQSAPALQTAPVLQPPPSRPFYPSMGAAPVQTAQFQLAPVQTLQAIPEQRERVREVIKEVPVPQIVEVPRVVEKVVEKVIERVIEVPAQAMVASGITTQAPPKVVEVPWQRKAMQAQPLVPMKDLEGRVINIACFMMFSLCFLPVMGAIACLCDRHYVFWMGCFWPTIVIAGCGFVFVAFVVTIQLLSKYAAPEHRSQFTMAFTWATFVALLGIILVPISLMANKYAAHVAGTVSMGCLSTLPQSELLADYSQVLYNIRISPTCANERSVTECAGWSRNWYTDYLEYLEYDMQCGPLCPEQPPPASAIVAPSMYSTPLPDVHHPHEPPLFGPPMQGIRSFLQGESETSQEVSLVHRHHHKASGLQRPIQPNGIMEHALPHLQAKRLFEKGTTRMTCFPLIATRLQVLLQTFGGLWYLEGMGLIVISFFTSLYTGCYFAFSKSAASV